MSRWVSALLLSALLSFLFAFPIRAEIYRWVDANGTVHFDDDPNAVPEDQRPGAKVFQSKIVSPPAVAEPTGPAQPTQATFAAGVARDLRLGGESREPTSALQNVGIYPSGGWNPTAALTPGAVEDVARTTRAAARARRVPLSVGDAEAVVIAAADRLGVAAPAPTVVVEPPPPPEPEPPLVVAPQVYVEVPPATVVIEQPEPGPYVTDGYFPPYGYLYAPIPERRGRKNREPKPERIVPLSNPAGHLRGPAVPPMPGPGPFQRPAPN